MPFQIIRNDITKVKADAIVNTANPRPVIGGGTDSAIYKAAGGKELFAERKKIGNIARGQAVSTPAFKLNAKFIIHTVGPVWVDGTQGEREILHACYANSLELADRLGCESIAFPMIATGVYGFPKKDALDIALAEIGKFLLTHEMEITLVVFDRKALEISKDLIGEINEYIDDHGVGILRDEEYGAGPQMDNLKSRRIDLERMESDLSAKSRRPAPKSDRIARELYEISQYEDACESSLFSPAEEGNRDYLAAPMAAASYSSSSPVNWSGKSLDDILKTKEDTFQQRLFHLIDERKIDDVSVYKNANVTKQVFSKIRSNENYQPTKKTALAFAISLHLDMETTNDLLSRAGFALSPGNKFDLIISYFIANGRYDINEINIVLFDYHQPLLGY